MIASTSTSNTFNWKKVDRRISLPFALSPDPAARARAAMFLNVSLYTDPARLRSPSLRSRGLSSWEFEPRFSEQIAVGADIHEILAVHIHNCVRVADHSL